MSCTTVVKARADVRESQKDTETNLKGEREKHFQLGKLSMVAQFLTKHMKKRNGPSQSGRLGREQM